MTWEFWYKLDSLGTQMPIITNAVSGVFTIGLLYNERIFLVPHRDVDAVAGVS